MKLVSSQLTLALLLLLASLAFAQEIAPGSCIEYSVGTCIRCERETHLYNGICYTNILGCTQYSEGTKCVQCDPTNFLLAANTCNPAPGITITPDLLATLYKYGGLQELDPGSQYGEAGFMPILFEKVQRWPTFMALNTFVRVGQYSHFISRTGNPVYSVHYYITGDKYSYKILYYGSGGGLFLCIADVPPTLKVTLRSLTPISSSNIIDFCIDYDENSVCLRCAANYHLENKKCYPNFGGCIRYRENICIQCMNYFFLVENRCVSDCLSVSDARSLLYFQGSVTTSTLQVYYGVPISQFYSITVRDTTTTVTTSFSNNINNNGGTAINLNSSSSSGAIRNSNSNGNNSFSATATTTVTKTTTMSSSSSSSSSLNSSSNSASSNPSSSSSTTSTGPSSSSSSSASTSDPSSTSTTTTVIQRTISIPSTLGQDSSVDITPTLPGSLVLNPSTSTTFTTSKFTSTSSGDIDSNCTFFGLDGLCIKCAPFYFKNKANRCEAVSPFCETYSEETGACLTCYPGYKLAKGQCNIAV